MRILAFSDIHCDRAACDAIVAAADTADLVIGAGDFAQRHDGLATTLDRLRRLEDKAVFVCGNNETAEALRCETRALVLQGGVTTRDGLTVAGIGCAVPPLPPLAWGSADLTEDAARTLLDPITACDILVSHSPPKGVADVHAQMGSIGSQAVREAAQRLQPQLLLCGHVHDCWGQEGHIGGTRVVNLGPTANWFELNP
ncbi:MAG: serine/threonine protein phosphatase [Rhodobacteraceae bacterium]|nr:serine/threonine protein phosphatase [Paracoccaceae bacterium]